MQVTYYSPWVLIFIGLPSNPVELNKVALVLDREHIGVYNIQKVIEILRPEKAAPKKEPKTDSEKIAVEVRLSFQACSLSALPL